MQVVGLLLLVYGFPGWVSIASSVCVGAPAALSSAVRPAPSFTLPDLAGKPRTLTAFRGRPVALFFFCGCDACHRCALTWGDAQRSGSLPPMQTLIVFSGDTETAHRFLLETGLDSSQTTMLIDPQDKVADMYHAPICPRVFVLNAQGLLRYTNNEAGTDSQTMPAAVLVSRIISAVRETPQKPLKEKIVHRAKPK